MIGDDSPGKGADQIEKKIGAKIMQASRSSVQCAPYCLNRSPESKQDIQQQNRAGGEVDAKFKKRGRLKKFEGNNAGDLPSDKDV